jgi:GNAT superfamily N-acetyltransferase
VVGSTSATEVDALRRCILGVEPTTVLLVVERTKPIGWCQWYLCRDYPDHAREVGADPDDAGIDYAIGNPTRRGQGVGTALIAALVTHTRQRHPRAGVIADPENSNTASRRVLKNNGFQLSTSGRWPRSRPRRRWRPLDSNRPPTPTATAGPATAAAAAAAAAAAPQLNRRRRRSP